jgi:hypothetical protein
MCSSWTQCLSYTCVQPGHSSYSCVPSPWTHGPSTPCVWPNIHNLSILCVYLKSLWHSYHVFTLNTQFDHTMCLTWTKNLSILCAPLNTLSIFTVCSHAITCIIFHHMCSPRTLSLSTSCVQLEHTIYSYLVFGTNI